jgi:hypothetical protein
MKDVVTRIKDVPWHGGFFRNMYLDIVRGLRKYRQIEVEDEQENYGAKSPSKPMIHRTSPLDTRHLACVCHKVEDEKQKLGER